MGKGHVAALSYADVTDWRDYETRLPSAFHLSASDPAEERRSCGDVSVRNDGRLSERVSRGLAGVDERDVGGGTVLSGAYVDEVHLEGVLEQLRGLGITVRRFEVAEKRYEEMS